MLKDKCIVIGVTGGIAAYKAVEVVRGLVKEGAEVHVIMTRSARQFIAPLTFQTLSGNLVHTEMFELLKDWNVEHIALADRADLFLIVPATANIIGKVASGIADDLLTTTIMAAKSPVVFAPAMNVNMYENPIVQENIKKLQEKGYRFIEPGTGFLACGHEGRGRLAETGVILEFARNILLPREDLANTTVLVTAGATREPIDPVRFITNRSTGKMGYAIAEAARDRGAQVILISGQADIKPPVGIKTVTVETAREMYNAVWKHFGQAKVIIKAAAVADYRPKKVSKNKIKKSGKDLTIELEPNPDILLSLGENKGDKILVGFAAESRDLEKNARNKIAKKNLDFIVANDITQPGAGFAVDTNIVKFIYPDGRIEARPPMSKKEVAHEILDRVVGVLNSKSN